MGVVGWAAALLGCWGMAMLEYVRLQYPLLRTRMFVLLVGVCGVAFSLGALSSLQPFLAVGVEVALILGLAVLAWPDIATLVVLAVLYSNAAVIAVKMHGMPSVVSIALPGLLILPLSSSLIFRREKLIVTPALPLLFLYTMMLVIGTVFADNVAVATSTVTGFLAEGIGLYFLLTNAIRTPAMLRLSIWSLLITAACIGGLSLFQQVTGTYHNDYWGFAQMSDGAFSTGATTINGDVMQRRLAGPIGEQNYYAQFMLMLVPVGFFRMWSERAMVLRALALVATGLIAVGVALTFSRGAAVSFALTIAIMTFMRYIKPYQIVVVILGIALLFQAMPEYATRLTSLDRLSGVTNQDGAGIADADSSVQSRTTEMMAAGLVFLDHPLIGVGPGLFKFYYADYAELIGLRTHAGARAAHDLYLEMAAESGVFGLTFFLLTVFVTLLGLARTRKRCLSRHPALANTATGFLLGIVSFLVTAVFLSLAFERYFWMLLALSGATIHISERVLAQDAASEGVLGAVPEVSDAPVG